MVGLKAVYQCFNGENDTRQIKVVSNDYKNTPIRIEFRLPDGNVYVPDDLITDENGEVSYSLPDEILFQNGRVSVQATVTLEDGRIEKSSIITFPVNCSINSEDDFTVLLYNNRLYPKGGNKLTVVGDNDSYKIKFTGIDEIGEVFAIFERDNKVSKPIILDENGIVNIPLWVLKKGSFNIGLYAEGFASTPLEIIVDESIVEDEGVITEDQDPSIVEQLLNKVNGIKYIKTCKVTDGRLILCFNDGAEVDAGFVGDGGTTVVTVQADQDQNDSTQYDYIKNRTHYKEVDENGNTIYHTLDNHYLNLENKVKQNSENPVTAKAVYEAVDNAEPEALTNLEIEELLKNFV